MMCGPCSALPAPQFNGNVKPTLKLALLLRWHPRLKTNASGSTGKLTEKRKGVFSQQLEQTEQVSPAGCIMTVR